MQTVRAFDAVIWDMDGTMFDTEKLHVDCWREVFERHGYANPHASLLKMIGKNEEASNEILLQDFGSDFPHVSLRAEKNEAVLARIERDGLPFKAGLLDMLDWLESQGLPSAIASSTAYAKIMAHLEHAGISRYFTAVVGGDQVERSKPYPDIFLEAAKRLGADPKRCLAFEDSHNGVTAALDAGMHVVMIPDLLEPTPDILERVHTTAPSLTDAIPYLRNILAA